MCRCDVYTTTLTTACCLTVDNIPVMMYISQFFYVGLVGLLIDLVQGSDSDQARVVVTAPVNPVKIDGILSIHCQVFNLPEESSVSIFGPLNGEKVKLSENEYVQQEIEDRVFLSQRRMEDSSVVYFLSITDVKQLDGGDYTCKVIIPNTMDVDTLVAVESIKLEIQHEPSETYPMCSHNLPAPVGSDITVKPGTKVLLNCTSETANPEVDMQWTRIKSGNLPAGPNVVRQDGMSYSTLDFRVSSREDQVMFICTITSSVFPDLRRTCHIGPFKVIPGPYDQHIPTEPPVHYELTTSHVEPLTRSSITKQQDCLKTCQKESPVLYWIITTTVAATLALIFFTIGMILLIRYYRMHSSVNYTSRQTFEHPRVPREDTYAELERKPSDKQFYMALELKEQLEHIPTCTLNELAVERQYRLPVN